MLTPIHRLERSVVLATDLAAAWAFFADPHNLLELTPPELGMTIDPAAPREVYAGLVLLQSVRALPFLRVPWLTEIGHARPPHYFCDEQRIGPYRFWYHEHLLEEVPGGVRVTDRVHYGVPGGPLSFVPHRLFVKGQLEKVFAYRRRRLVERFGEVTH